MSRWTVEADGGSRGNPGPAGSGTVVIDDTGTVVAAFGKWLGITTNNVAEYTAMLDGVTWVFDHDPDAEVEVVMDSKLVVEQMSGRWKVKHPSMRALYTAALGVIAGRSVLFRWVPRFENSRADAIANLVMDSGEDVTA